MPEQEHDQTTSDEECPRCLGTGQIDNAPCTACQGTGRSEVPPEIPQQH